MTIVANEAVDDLLRAHLDAIEGDLVAPIEAQKFVARMREVDAYAFRAWLDDRAETVVCEVIGAMLRSRRAIAQQRHGAQAFAKADAENVVGSMLDVRYVVTGIGRRLCDMTRDDLETVAADYDSASSRARFEAAFLRAIKKLLPDSTSTVGDVLTEADVTALRSIKAR